MEWQKNLEQLVQFKLKYGNCNVPCDWQGNRILAQWVENLRVSKNKLPLPLIKSLEELGFDFDFQEETRWIKFYRELEAYYHRFNHTYIPSNVPEYYELLNWANLQRDLKSYLKKEQIKKLDNLFFDWQKKGENDISWELMFQELLKFKEKYGHTNVSLYSYEDKALATWVANQRNRKKNISEYRKNRLREIGFRWAEDFFEEQEEKWEKRFRELVEFKKEYGHTKVPIKFKANKRLASWVSEQRLKEDRIPPLRKKRLDEIGFLWKSDIVKWDEDHWENMFRLLVEYKKKHGQLNIPVTYKENPELGWWIASQRQLKKGGKLSLDKQNRLGKIGFKWANEIHKSKWDVMFEKYKIYSKSAKLQKTRTMGTSLSSWVNSQRINRRKGILSEERIKRLSEIDFVWEPEIKQQNEQNWEYKYQELKVFYERHGHCYVSAKYPDAPNLASWINKQRAKYRQEKLSRDKIQKLEHVKFNWEDHIIEANWKEYYNELAAFKQKYGHTHVPKNYNTTLGSWVFQHRTKYKKGTLSAEKIRMLEDIGMDWHVFDIRWEKMYNELVAFKNQYGDINLSQKDVRNPKIAQWVTVQKRIHALGTLTQERIQRLEKLGIIWSEKREDIIEKLWNQMFKKLLLFKKVYGHLSVPARFVDTKLSLWVSYQRSKKKKGSLSLEKIRKLEEVGFIFNIRSRN